ncbi:3'5'-cyclic nucleotide phosphodiesterase [Nitzschia inconspicua]|uniref:3'5'-cyclic nucleotide phosphodiesterase n=1 Tax=Nitzschia inconspicua TaxID=303405 RepID=A0A9K3PX61_9STRA|nr:3'5'-cyclic nucleotide phosphodiesterase [Nitzschia inconspicua]
MGRLPILCNLLQRELTVSGLDVSEQAPVVICQISLLQHASHVLNSVQKLLKRVILAEQERVDSATRDSYATKIASDPLTQFSIVFSALIHDVDHSSENSSAGINCIHSVLCLCSTDDFFYALLPFVGVPNGQLIKEEAHVATLYNNKSVAEQNSLDLDFELLMDPRYKDLQRCIFCSREELHRFRQLLVNVVIATDIFDKDMKELRSRRWEKAFHQENEASLSQVDEFNLKGTIVLEYIMQASDVSHTMQHWYIYKKWNQRLFEEMYTAFVSGRGDQDPSEGWYKGELWFFDNYVIRLAKKLQECRVFGAASDECLNYAEFLSERRSSGGGESRNLTLCQGELSFIRRANQMIGEEISASPSAFGGLERYDRVCSVQKFIQGEGERSTEIELR